MAVLVASDHGIGGKPCGLLKQTYHRRIELVRFPPFRLCCGHDIDFGQSKRSHVPDLRKDGFGIMAERAILPREESKLAQSEQALGKAHRCRPARHMRLERSPFFGRKWRVWPDAVFCLTESARQEEQ